MKNPIVRKTVAIVHVTHPVIPLPDNHEARGTMPKYNGHKSWNAWNVALWINNDPGLYADAIAHIKDCRNKDLAAYEMTRLYWGQKTPDGAPFTYSSIRAAMRGMEA